MVRGSWLLGVMMALAASPGRGALVSLPDGLFIDQSSGYGWTLDPVLSRDGSPGTQSGQEFVPSVAEHVGVRVQFLKSGSLPDGVRNITVQIRENTIDGPIVPGTTLFRPIEFPIPDRIPLPRGEWTVRFEFDDIVHLDPGELYVLEIMSPELLSWAASGPPIGPNGARDIYPKGRPIVDGVPLVDALWNMTFSTLVIPEPAIGVLVLAGTLCLALHRPRNPIKHK